MGVIIRAVRHRLASDLHQGHEKGENGRNLGKEEEEDGQTGRGQNKLRMSKRKYKIYGSCRILMIQNNICVRQ